MAQEELKIPEILPHGWRTKVASALGIHRNSVYNALQRADDDPLRMRVMHTIAQKYGKKQPKNTEA